MVVINCSNCSETLFNIKGIDHKSIFTFEGKTYCEKCYMELMEVLEQI